MTWTRLSEDFMDRTEVYSASRSARLLHIEALVWCNKRGTDGRIDAAAVGRITDALDWPQLVDELERCRTWQRVADDVWQLDWSEQEDAVDVEARRVGRAATQKRYRKRQAMHQRDDHSLCDPRYCPALVTGNESSNATPHETTTRPVPARPVPYEVQGTGTAGRPRIADAPGSAQQEQERVLPVAPHSQSADCCNLPDIHPVHRSAS